LKCARPLFQQRAFGHADAAVDGHPVVRVFDPAKSARHPEEAIVADAVELQQPMLKSGGRSNCPDSTLRVFGIIPMTALARAPPRTADVENIAA